MAITFVIDGKPATKQRLPYIPREGEIVEIRDNAKKIKMYTVDLVQHRIDNASTIGIADTYIHLKSVKSKKKKAD